MAYRLRRNLFDYDYDYEDELVLRSQLLYPVAPVVVAPVVPVWFVGIDPAYYSIMSWMNSVGIIYLNLCLMEAKVWADPLSNLARMAGQYSWREFQPGTKKNSTEENASPTKYWFPTMAG